MVDSDPKRALISEPKRCLGCGYILDGLPEPRCPECGRGFDPADPHSYGPAHEDFSPRTCLIIALSTCGMLLLGGVCSMLPPAVLRWTYPVQFALILGAYFGAGLVIHDSVRGLRRRDTPDSRRLRWAALAVGVLALVLLVAMVLGPAILSR